jgi:hypothetical protein
MISQPICLIGRSRRIRTSSRLKASLRLKEKLTASVQHTGRRSINMTKPPLRPRNGSFAIGQRAEALQNLVEPPADRTHIHFGMRVVVRP